MSSVTGVPPDERRASALLDVHDAYDHGAGLPRAERPPAPLATRLHRSLPAGRQLAVEPPRHPPPHPHPHDSRPRLHPPLLQLRAGARRHGVRAPGEPRRRHREDAQELPRTAQGGRLTCVGHRATYVGHCRSVNSVWPVYVRFIS